MEEIKENAKIFLTIIKKPKGGSNPRCSHATITVYDIGQLLVFHNHTTWD